MIKRLITKRGSAAVFLSMVFVAFSICIVSAILISRQIASNSICESYGRVWERAILSEYDRNLLNDYGLMAYFGNEAEVTKKVKAYADYSLSGRLGIRNISVSSSLSGYELSSPENFRNAIKQSLSTQSVSALMNGSTRNKKSGNSAPEDGTKTGGEKSSNRVIGNEVVKNTLPSAGSNSGINSESIKKLAEQLNSSDGVKNAAVGTGIDMAFIYLYFDNHVTEANKTGDGWFTNEWEYILGGSPSDEKNFTSCKTKLFILRNALNLASLYKDPEKVELITAAAEIITPGPIGAITQLLIAEAWAALETNEDMKTLYDNERVPIIKSGNEWKIGLESVLNSDKMKKGLDEEALESLEENSDKLKELSSAEKVKGIISDGLNYDEYLMIMMLTMSEDVRLLRIMDLVQINMKFRHYRDFNLMEYFVGVRFDIQIDGKSHSFEEAYK